jgi:membrane-bound metal-dependent hydrolase YbcI (DUF457 family)
VLGREHFLSGGVTGAAAGEFALRLPPAGTVVLAGLAAAFAVLPDLDVRGSCAARSLGPLSEGFAWVTGKVSGGHRHGTHSVLGVAMFTFLAWAASWFIRDPGGKAALGLFLLLALAAGLRAIRVHGLAADAVAAGAAAAIVAGGWYLALVPVACGLGCATHIAGDMLTVSGCPLAYPFSPRDFRVLPRPLAFVTGTAPETCIVLPALVVMLGLLAWHAVSAA